MPDSNPPEKEKENSGVGLYVVGALVLAGAIAAIVVFSGDDTPKKAETPAPPATEETFAAPPPPPPPPKKTAEPEDAGDDAAEDAEPVASASAKVASAGGGGGGGSCSNCKGTAGSALQSSLRGSAGAARGCYQKSINKSGGGAAEGKMTVVVTVASNGSVCSASIANDTVGSPSVSNCVLKQFQGKTFPRPEDGCVTAQIPINFEVKKD